MELSSDHVGAYTKILQVEVTARLCMNYAAAVGDGNPLYFDDTRADGIIAPPMLSCALTWPLSGDFVENWERHSFPRPFPYELMQQQVLYTETLMWHRIMRPGDKLRIQGRMVAILPHRAGAYMVVRYDATTVSGDPIFTEYVGALLRRIRCSDEGRGADNLPAIPDYPATSEPVWTETIPVDPLAAHIYDACTNMHFPIHTSLRFARSVGLREVILQGTATLSLAVRELVNREAAGDASRLESTSCTFTNKVVPGSRIVVRLLKKEEGPAACDLFFDVVNATGNPAISGGHVRLGPSRLRREVP